jgi:hypothetical protein
MDNKADRRKFIIIVIGVFAFVVIIGIAAVMISNHAKKNSSSKTKDITTGSSDYYDPNSHQTVSNPAGKTPDTYGATTDAPIYLGTDALLSNSLTDTQVGDYKFAIYQYLKQANIKATEVSIAVETVVVPPHDPNSTSMTQSITFNIVINRKDTYRVEIDYTDLDSIDLKLADNTGKALYDSGTVTNQNIY